MRVPAWTNIEDGFYKPISETPHITEQPKSRSTVLTILMASLMVESRLETMDL